MKDVMPQTQEAHIPQGGLVKLQKPKDNENYLKAIGNTQITSRGTASTLTSEQKKAKARHCGNICQHKIQYTGKILLKIKVSR